MAKHDPVNHPSHYTMGPVEVIDAIESWQLGFHLGNAVKYIARAGRKGSRIEDLKKARWYIERELARSERAESPSPWIEAGVVPAAGDELPAGGKAKP